MVASTKLPVYRIYLLTVWQAQEQSEADEDEWRFHLTDPQTGKRYGFTSPETLLAALEKLAREKPPATTTS